MDKTSSEYLFDQLSTLADLFDRVARVFSPSVRCKEWEAFEAGINEARKTRPTFAGIRNYHDLLYAAHELCKQHGVDTIETIFQDLKEKGYDRRRTTSSVEDLVIRELNKQLGLSNRAAKPSA